MQQEQTYSFTKTPSELRRIMSQRLIAFTNLDKYPYLDFRFSEKDGKNYLEICALTGKARISNNPDFSDQFKQSEKYEEILNQSSLFLESIWRTISKHSAVRTQLKRIQRNENSPLNEFELVSRFKIQKPLDPNSDIFYTVEIIKAFEF